MKELRQIISHVTYYLAAMMLFVPAWSHAKCDIVAVVFDEVICQADISISNAGAKPLPFEERHGLENSRLSNKIRAIAAQHLLTKESYTPTDTEINDFIIYLEKSKAKHTRQHKEKVATIVYLLKTNQYTEIHRKRLEDALATYRRVVEQLKRIEEGKKLRDEDMRNRFGEDAVKKLHEKLKKSSRRIGEQWVASWKMNKALYEKYGGRLIFQQAGVEPIDAYRAQLKDIREKGSLKILKSEYTNVFSGLEHYLDIGHNYLSDNDDRYFDRPYWETTDLDAAHQRTINEYKEIPHTVIEERTN